MAFLPPQIIPPRDPEQLGQWMAEIAKAGARLGFCGRMCHDCAFKKPLDLNQGDTLTTGEVFEQLAWEGRLNCHTPEHKDAGTPCIGFEYAKRFLKSNEVTDIRVGDPV
jgi:hypothetical protein